MSRKVSLKVVHAPQTGAVLEAPPVIRASDHSVDYTCGHCSTILLHADENQAYGVLLRCANCGSYNMTDSWTIMRAHKPAYWRKGQRVCRNGTGELGTIVEANGQIKVKWDDGHTSYFYRNKLAKLHSADNRSGPFGKDLARVLQS